MTKKTMTKKTMTKNTMTKKTVKNKIMNERVGRSFKKAVDRIRIKKGLNGYKLVGNPKFPKLSEARISSFMRNMMKWGQRDLEDRLRSAARRRGLLVQLEDIFREAEKMEVE